MKYEEAPQLVCGAILYAKTAGKGTRGFHIKHLILFLISTAYRQSFYPNHSLL